MHEVFRLENGMKRMMNNASAPDFLNGICFSVEAGRGCTTMVGRIWEDKSLTCVNCTLAKCNSEDQL